MKKIALILLFFIYSLSTFGIGIKQFYCCGRLKSTNISVLQLDTQEKCSNGDETSDCCKTKVQSLKGKESHVPPDVTNAPLKYITDLSLFKPFLEIYAIANRPMVVVNRGHAPPWLHATPIHVLHCIYRI